MLRPSEAKPIISGEHCQRPRSQRVGDAPVSLAARGRGRRTGRGSVGGAMGPTASPRRLGRACR